MWTDTTILTVSLVVPVVVVSAVAVIGFWVTRRRARVRTEAAAAQRPAESPWPKVNLATIKEDMTNYAKRGAANGGDTGSIWH